MALGDFAAAIAPISILDRPTASRPVSRNRGPGCVLGWRYRVPLVYPAIAQANEVLSRYTLPWLEKTFGHVNPALGLLFNLAAFASILFVLSMTLIPILERVFIRDLFRPGQRGG